MIRLAFNCFICTLKITTVMNQFKELPPSMIPALLGIFAFVFIVVIIVYVLYLKNLQDLLKAIREPNRAIAPSMVWLLMFSMVSGVLNVGAVYYEGLTAGITLQVVSLLISIGVLVWQFILVKKISESIEAEYRSRNTNVEPKPTYNLGLALCICGLLQFTSFVPVLTVLAGMAGVVGFVIWIIYWVKTAEYKKNIQFLPLDNDEDSELFGTGPKY